MGNRFSAYIFGRVCKDEDVLDVAGVLEGLGVMGRLKPYVEAETEIGLEV
jgi:hypothetical protein